MVLRGLGAAYGPSFSFGSGVSSARMRGNEIGGDFLLPTWKRQGSGPARFGLDGVWQSRLRTYQCEHLDRLGTLARAHSFALCLLLSRLPFVTR